MKVKDLKELLDAEVFCCEDNLERQVDSACGCDLMSDVLAYVKDQGALLTGLVNPQVVRTAVMMDMICIDFVRSKEPTEDIVALARDNGIVVLNTSKRLYEACGILYSNGLTGKATKS